MSAIGGIYNFDNEPVRRNFLLSMGCALATRGPDGGSEVIHGAIGMVYSAFHTTRESRFESQPLISPSGGHVLCWDGRLDNREDLISILCDEIQGNVTDASIVLAAYRKWGTTFPARLVGDFAFSLWDPTSRTLLLGRDHVGVRQLFYSYDEHQIVWSTDLNILLDLAGSKLEINEEYVADFITRRPDPAQTPYKRIYAVPPAHVVTAASGRLQITRFWGFDPTREVRYQTDAEYEEHFRHLFREAVSCRMRSDRPVWSELSGGFDSSSIVCMAHDICERGETEAPAFETVSRVFDEAKGSDERKYIEPVEARIGKKGLHLREDDYRMGSPLEAKYSSLMPNPLGTLGEYYHALSNAMKARDARVMLVGHGGDEVLNSSPDPAPELSELLLRCKPLQLHRRLSVWSKAFKKSYAKTFWRRAVGPALPDWIQVHRETRAVKILFSVYTEEFVKRMNFRERLLGPANEFGFRYPVGKTKAKYVSILVRVVASGVYQSLVDANVTFPFSHRPLMEFMIALPFDQCTRPGETRSLAHRSLKPLLPVEIAERQDKGLSVYAYLAALAREAPRLEQLFTDARICAFGYVKPAAIKELVELARTGKSHRSTLLMSLICMENWLRAVESRGAAVSIAIPDPLFAPQHRSVVQSPLASV
jgi:asparagine synthase (glutamine-hydrolysing)